MELLRALGALCEPPAPGQDAVGSALGLARPDPEEWTRLFALELPPYASIYLGPEGMIGGEAQERIAGFWRALGLTPPAEPDHLASLLGLHAALADAEREEDDPARRTLRREARAALVWEHLASWLPPYLDRLERLAEEPHRSWARLVREALGAEARALPVPVGLPAHLRAAPELAVPADAGLDELVAALLAPVRTGLLLARADLVCAARELGLGLRLGERRAILRALLAQDPAGTCTWLATQAREAAFRPEPAWLPRQISTFWSGRAAAAAALLSDLAMAAEGLEVSHAR